MSDKSNSTHSLSTFHYLNKEGLYNVRSNRSMSIASIVILASCLLLISLSWLMFANLNTALQNVQDQSIIMVYLNNKISQSEKNDVRADIESLSDIKDVTFVSKEQAYKQQLHNLGSDAQFVKSLESNPFPDAYEVTLKSLKGYSSTLDALQEIDHVARVRGNSELASQVKKLRDSLIRISTCVIVLLILVSLFIVMSTIKITIFNRQLEINIMRMIGASTYFIRWPFVVEGFFLGLVSGILSVLATWGIYGISSHSLNNIQTIVGGHVLPFSQFTGQMILLIVIGACLGAVGSLLSTIRYTDEDKIQTITTKRKQHRRKINAFHA